MRVGNEGVFSVGPTRVNTYLRRASYSVPSSFIYFQHDVILNCAPIFLDKNSRWRHTKEKKMKRAGTEYEARRM